MTDNRDKLIERIRKLLALSTSPNEHEAAVAAGKAQALLAEHNIAMSDVATDDDKAEEAIVEESGDKTSPYPWRRQLANAIAQMYFCKYFWRTRWLPSGKSKYDEHCFVGAKHNIAVAKIMFTYLHETVDRLAKEGARGLPKSEQSPYRATFRGVCSQRVVTRIYVRIREAKEGKIQSSTGSNLPALLNLYDSWNARLEDHLKDMKIRVKKQTLPLLHARGAADGRAAGDRIGLDNQVRGGVKPTLRIA